MARGRSTDVTLSPRRVLDWLYAGRLSIALAVFATALIVGSPWGVEDAPVTGTEVQLVALTGLIAATLFTALSYYFSHVREEEPTLRFLYGQAVLDILLVTGIVHITGGSESVFPPLLYVALVSAYALLVPLRAVLLVALCAVGAYVLDLALAYPASLRAEVMFQVAVFLAVALASGIIGGRLRQAREELQTVEGALRRLRLDTADVLRTLGAGVLTLDTGGRLAYMNPAAGELLDLEAPDWLNRDLLPVLKERAPAVVGTFRDTVRQERAVTDRQAEIRKGDGAEIPVTVSTAYMWRSGAEASVTLVFQDLRPVRQLEELRMQADRLQAVAELSASLAHEIRNPLASIRSAVEQLSLEEMAESDNRMLLRLVVRESERLDRLLGDFGDFAGMDRIDREPVDLEQIFRDVVSVAREHPDATDAVRFETRVGGDVEDVWGDGDLLHRTFLNLVLNAVQVWAESGAAGGELTVRLLADRMPPDVVPPQVYLGDAIRVRVVDDGPGMGPEELERIFDPFFSNRTGGTGLGLSIVYRAVRAHGGSITVNSTPGEETVFEIALPRRDREVRERGTRERSTYRPAP